MRYVFLSLAFLYLTTDLAAQAKIVALGSSTTLGAAASPTDSSWVARLQSFYRKNTSVSNPDTIIYKVGEYGYTTYKELPTAFAGFSREIIDEGKNVTKALSYNPDIIIINLPSNDVAAYDWHNITPAYNIKETMDNFRTMYNYITAAGVRCFITTTQPRNDLSEVKRQLQRDLVDSITNTFGIFAINFWDDLVVPDGSNLLKDEVRNIGHPDENYHLNNQGHRHLFQRVRDKNIFAGNTPLPIKISKFQAQMVDKTVKINWHTTEEDPATLFEIQRSANGKDFQTLYQIIGIGLATDYSWTDTLPLDGKNFYRLKINEPAKISYSKIIVVINNKKQLIRNLYADGSQLHLQLASDQQQPVRFCIISWSGIIITQQTFKFITANSSITIPISALSPGGYFLKLIAFDGSTAIEGFIKWK